MAVLLLAKVMMRLGELRDSRQQKGKRLTLAQYAGRSSLSMSSCLGVIAFEVADSDHQLPHHRGRVSLPQGGHRSR